MGTTLTMSTFDAPARPLNIPLPIDPPEGGWTWPPTSVTLIAGEDDAVLIDTLPTVEDSAELADWIEASGKRLTHVFITHAHVDHYLGTAALKARFPGVKVVSTAATARFIAEEQKTRRDTTAYAAIFADDIVGEIVIPEALPADGRIDLEGHDIIGVPTGQSDLSESSYAWVPELSAAVVGDIAYNDVHVPLFESSSEARRGWIATLREIQSRAPRVVIASHRKADAVNDAGSLAKTIEYVELGDELLSADPRPSLAEFVARVVEADPSRANITTLIYSGAVQGLR
ncbi:glyoxylase-like metal-dependent hydrolase (beta-lactamase superfamily II) [Saccharothrix coeruleofusca]|uniref:MBL fold metallo-hydrolase n=1 Tax=Saccharothrix coeruleofusca TaxID=33919 RepID=UPI001AE60A25|nr:MBL fold metallo-hydrolase [Saccharothrix coeruleofusca]MBP2334636.1 glyoxylase-like metal-dependent hydrolase (beta-lactamase superfamily II) [Saccharothrix coeruleofusca]